MQAPSKDFILKGLFLNSKETIMRRGKKRLQHRTYEVEASEVTKIGSISPLNGTIPQNPNYYPTFKTLLKNRLKARIN